ncbi:MAG: hypothetical protein ACPGJS_10815 [Flammeovirgaceae bacterium]
MNKASNMAANLDFSYIHDIAGGQTEPFLNLLKIVSKNLNEYPPKLKEAFDHEDWLSLKELAHKYKSCTAYLNFPELNEKLVDLEFAKERELGKSEINEILNLVVEYSLFTQEKVTEKLAEILT